MLIEYMSVWGIRFRFFRISSFYDFYYFLLELFMKETTPKILVSFFALVYVAGCIGFSAVSHYCHQGHHQMVTAADCCCVDSHPEPGDDSCRPAPITTTAAENLASSSCCEIIYHYHQVEEAAPLAVALFISTSAQACTLLPGLKNDVPAYRDGTHTPLASRQRTLPLLI